MQRMAYLCLQATNEGQASHAHVHEIIAGLRRRQWEVTLYEPSYARTNSVPGTFGKIVEMLKVQLRLIRELKQYKLIYIRSHFGAFPASLAALFCGVPVVQELNGPDDELVHSFPTTRYFMPLFKGMIRTPLGWADTVITVTPQLEQWVLQKTRQKNVTMIPNGANTDVFCPTARTRYELAFPFAIFFGSLVPWQGIETLLDAIRHPAWPEDLHLVVLGDGPDRTRVEAAATESPKIHYLGRLPYLEVAGIVRQSLCAIIPKNDKGDRSKTGLSPLKLYETLACAVPAVVTDFPGQADLIRSERCGLVVRPDDAEAIADAAAYLYGHPEKRAEMGRIGRSLVEGHFSWDHQAEATDGVLQALLRTRSEEKSSN